MNVTGKVLWRCELDEPILSQPEIAALENGPLLVCGAGSGSLFAVTSAGDVAWEAPVGDQVDASVTVLHRDGQDPMILCTGLWGNLYAFDVEGKLLWKHIFRSKNRAKPLLLDMDQDGEFEILVAAYNQHVYVFDQQGNMVDDIRLGGGINAFPMLVRDSRLDRTDVIILTTTLLAHRLRTGPPVSPYGPTASPEGVRFTCLDPDRVTKQRASFLPIPTGPYCAPICRSWTKMESEKYTDASRHAPPSRSHSPESTAPVPVQCMCRSRRRTAMCW